MTVLSNLFALLLVLCILVLLHEWGHFFTARLFGIRPYIFSFGIGWRLIGLQSAGAAGGSPSARRRTGRRPPRTREPTSASP
jgi:hypothetical protein